jgi:NADH dehydrogenase (ubiquinone) Fe-S protein 3
MRPYSPVRCVGCTRPHPPEVRPTARLVDIHTEPVDAASASPFSEATSPNPTLTRYAEASEKLHDYASYLMQCLPKFIQQFSVLKDELTLYVAPSAVIPVLTFLRDHSQCQFKALMDISGVDFPERDKRFEVVYHLLSIKYAARIRVKTYAGEADAVPSATSLFSGANWYFATTASLGQC